MLPVQKGGLSNDKSEEEQILLSLLFSPPHALYTYILYIVHFIEIYLPQKPIHLQTLLYILCVRETVFPSCIQTISRFTKGCYYNTVIHL